MSSDIAPDVSALAINVTIPEGLRWTDTRRGEEFTLTTLNVRLQGCQPRQRALGRSPRLQLRVRLL